MTTIGAYQYNNHDVGVCQYLEYTDEQIKAVQKLPLW